MIDVMAKAPKLDLVVGTRRGFEEPCPPSPAQAGKEKNH
jgi:hypothetical protein